MRHVNNGVGEPGDMQFTLPQQTMGDVIVRCRFQISF